MNMIHVSFWTYRTLDRIINIIMIIIIVICSGEDKKSIVIVCIRLEHTT